jgi:uncharacterized protein
VRVRHHDSVARIEVPPSDLPRMIDPVIAEKATAAALEAGFQFCSLDLLGYRTGSLNEVLPGRRLRVVRSGD